MIKLLDILVAILNIRLYLFILKSFGKIFLYKIVHIFNLIFLFFIINELNYKLK